jgi:hypothetical protein
MVTVIAAVAAGGASAEANRVVRVQNETNTNLVHLYASGRVYSGGYADWLGSEILSPNEYININFDDRTHDCDMAIVAVFADGEVVSKEHFNVCTQENLTFTGN